MALFYADASAIVKLIRAEPEGASLRRFLEGAELISCELVLTEIPRAIRRAGAHDPNLCTGDLIDRAGETIDAIGLVPLDRGLLAAAGALGEPGLRALDAIHVVAAASVAPIDGLITYDERQAAAARLAGLRTVSPGRR